MAFKFITFCTVVAAANAGFIPAAPLAYATGPAYAKLATAPVLTKTIDTEYDPNPQYSYAYDVQDNLTGDIKNQHEIREGNTVTGQYSLIESDGSRRIVDYTADSINGFNAVVRKEPATKLALAATPAIAKYTQLPINYGAPSVAKLAAPIAAAYAGPALTYGAPAAAAPIATMYGAPSVVAAAPAYASPVAKFAAPVAIAKFAPHPYIAHVTYTTPLFSYSH